MKETIEKVASEQTKKTTKKGWQRDGRTLISWRVSDDIIIPFREVCRQRKESAVRALTGALIVWLMLPDAIKSRVYTLALNPEQAGKYKADCFLDELATELSCNES